MRRSKIFPSSEFPSNPAARYGKGLFVSGVSTLVLSVLLLLASVCFAQAPSSSPQLTADLTHSPGWVVIPVDEYQSLRARAYPAERTPEPPPVDATLTRVDYELQVGAGLATGRASLTVDVLKDGWVRVPIPSGLLVR